MTQVNKSKSNGRHIRKLDEGLKNQIAAGEVIERPAAVVKELIENAIDASATSISISVSHGGKSLIKVIDNGWGIRREELKLALTNHATSKMDQGHLFNVTTLGFRGEALSSIAAVSKLSLKSRAEGELEAAEINSLSGNLKDVKPVALSSGTSVEIRDLFYSTPARLKFLKSDRAETQAIFDAVMRLALATPNIRFVLQDITKEPKKTLLDFPEEKLNGKYFSRIEKALGLSFSENCVELDSEKNGYFISGYVSLPTISSGTSLNQYFFVNDRPVKDKLLLGAVRAAYFDFMSKHTFPSVVIYLNCDLGHVDVNVHPMKSEIRFKFPKDVRSLIISAIKNSLLKNGLKSNNVLATKTLSAFSPSKIPFRPGDNLGKSSHVYEDIGEKPQMILGDEASWYSGKIEDDRELDLATLENLPLGVAKAQLHASFIVSQSKNSLILVDQHAAHERITYESLKLQFENKNVESQDLLIPEIIELTENQKDIILEFSDMLAKIGVVIEEFGEKAVCVRSIPSLLGSTDVKTLSENLIEELLTQGRFDSIERHIYSIISRISCHGSVRAGRKMNAHEMNHLLRQMESTPFSAQCNHGRPTFIELKLGDIEKLFGRS